jgi:hypothetical protein
VLLRGNELSKYIPYYDMTGGGERAVLATRQSYLYVNYSCYNAVTPVKVHDRRKLHLVDSLNIAFIQV